MRILVYSFGIAFFFGLLLTRCGPTSVSTGIEDLSQTSKNWIAFTGNESVRFAFEDDTIRFTGNGIESFYETVRYKTDQGGFFNLQKDYYADLERMRVTFESPASDYFFCYFLEKNKSETGDWEMLKVTISDNQYYSNQLRIIIYESDDFNKGKNYRFQASMTLAGKTFKDVYFWKQERRPFELYFTKAKGVIAFKISSNQLWVIQDQ